MRGVWVLVAVAGCGRLDCEPLLVGDGPPDASADADVPCSSFGPWSAPVKQTDLTSTSEDWEPTLNPVDGVTLVFSSDRSSSTQLYVVRRQGTGWSTPMMISSIDVAPGANSGAEWSRSGDQLIFASDRSDPGIEHAYIASFDGSTFGAPT